MKAISCPLPGYISTTFRTLHTSQTCEEMHEIRVVSSVRDIIAPEWLRKEGSDFQAFVSLFAASEASNPEIGFRYAMIFQEEQSVAVAAFQIIPFSASQIKSYTSGSLPEENFQSGISRWAGRIAKRFLQTRKVRLLVNGNVFLTNGTGFFYDESSVSCEQAYRLLIRAAEKIAESDRPVIATLLKDTPQISTQTSGLLQRSGYRGFETEPDMVLPLEWENIEDYAEAMSSKYRQRLRSTMKKSAELICRELTGEEVCAQKEVLFELFGGVMKEDKFSLADINVDYFPALKSYLGDDLKIFAYYLGDKMVAYSSLIMNDQDLSAHYIGYDCSLNRQMKLYQRLLYDMIRVGIVGGYEKISFGRTAMEIKSTMGAVPQFPGCYLKIENQILRRLGEPFLRNIRIASWEPRHPFKENSVRAKI